MGKYRKYNEYHKAINNIEYKQCMDCNEWFIMNSENFNIVNGHKDGFNHRCKKCQEIYQKDYYNNYKVNGTITGKILEYKKRKHFNTYEIKDDYTVIFIKHKDKILETLIDTEDLQKLIDLDFSWHVKWLPNAQDYYVGACVFINKENNIRKSKSYYLHYIIMDAKEGEYVDHYNHNPLDNRKSNLRVTSNDKNTKHRKGKNKNNKSGYRNVCWIKSEQCYKVQLMIDGKNTILGKFDDVHEAGKFAEKMRQKYYGEFKGNG